MSYVTLAAATLPSVPLDFRGNRDRILESIRVAKERGALLRTGPELEIPGYGCLDHHLEGDTFLHSWEVLRDIISDRVCEGMLIDLGMGVRHCDVRYNTRVLCTYRTIFGIRPKMSLANDGLYREMRHFTPWFKPREVETYELESIIQEVTGQKTVPIGDMILLTPDTAITCESCEELFVPLNPSTFSGLKGAEIILNSSASHAELRKLKTRLDLISNLTRKLGGIYVYANATGVDGEARMLYDGSSMIVQNGDVMAQGSQFSLKPVEVTVATVDLEKVRSFRSRPSRNLQGAQQPVFPQVKCDIRLARQNDTMLPVELDIAQPMELRILHPMEEIHMATAVYMWQYLIRTKKCAGFFLPLSGGLDSATVAVFVYGLARLVLQSIQAGEHSTLEDLRRVTGEKTFTPQKAEEIVAKLLHTCYMGTVNSSSETESRATRLSERIGAYHSNTKIDKVIDALEDVGAEALGFKPQYAVEGGSQAENLAKQNVQARARMVLGYYLAALSTRAPERKHKHKHARPDAPLLVLAAGNVDENLRGYYTKYDASSGDLAPLGSISKNDAKGFLYWARLRWDLPILTEFLDAVPTAELLPLSAGVQHDESEGEMGMTYDELSVFGHLRKVDQCGPWSMYRRLSYDWRDRAGPRLVADKVCRFFRYYAINRHKATVVTPSVHLSAYNPDDNRHDLRPFLYDVDWPWQFEKINKHADEMQRKIDMKKEKEQKELKEQSEEKS